MKIVGCYYIYQYYLNTKKYIYINISIEIFKYSLNAFIYQANIDYIEKNFC